MAGTLLYSSEFYECKTKRDGATAVNSALGSTEAEVGTVQS